MEFETAMCKAAEITLDDAIAHYDAVTEYVRQSGVASPVHAKYSAFLKQLKRYEEAIASGDLVWKKERKKKPSAEVRRGEWIETERGCVISCSKCGYRLELCYPDGTEVRRLPYCPECGAKMDGGKKEE